MTRFGLLLSDDLIFTSRITGTARAQGFAISAARSSEVLLRLAQERVPACVIVDLANSGLDIDLLARELKSGAAPPNLVAYGSHVDTATLKKARAAGCDLVLPRSKFVEDLTTELPGWFGAKEPEKPSMDLDPPRPLPQENP